jgi:hypothetical protein
LVVARLSILGGKREGESLELEPGVYQLGTGRAADIQLRDKGVGFKHAQLTVREDEVVVEDFKSRGGTFVNEEKIKAGDEVRVDTAASFRVGTTALQVTLGVGAEAKADLAAEDPGPAVADGIADDPGPAVADVAADDPGPAVADVAADDPGPAVADVAAEPAPDPGPAIADVAAGDPGPAVADVAADEPAPDPGPAVPDVAAAAAAGTDVALLQQAVRDLERQLAAKTQEADALVQALEASAPAGGGGALAGYDEGLSEDFAGQVKGLEYQVQEEAAKVAERDEIIANLQGRIDDAKLSHEQELKRVKSEQSSVEESLEKAYTEIARLKKTLDKETNLEELEEANALLLDENETLKEELSGLKYVMEEEQSRRGELVRGRVSELRQEAQRMEESNAEMRTLVEAYEEKIDELDERLEELEGENEALEQLVEDTRGELSKTRKERETMVKTLRKKLKALELRLEESRAAQARSDSEQRQAV